MNCLQSLVLFIATIGSSSDLVYYLVLLLLLLLSGDVELNPGPMIDDRPGNNNANPMSPITGKNTIGRGGI